MSRLNYDLKLLENQINLHKLSSEEQKIKVEEIRNEKRNSVIFLNSILVLSIIALSLVCFDNRISVRFEFCVQATDNFIVLATMISITKELIQQIRSVFGSDNQQFETEIKHMIIVLGINTISFSLRVIRNVVIVILWKPCYCVNQLTSTSIINAFFYLLAEFLPCFIVIAYHQRNYSSTNKKSGSENNDQSR